MYSPLSPLHEDYEETLRSFLEVNLVLFVTVEEKEIKEKWGTDSSPQCPAIASVRPLPRHRCSGRIFVIAK